MPVNFPCPDCGNEITDFIHYESGTEYRCRCGRNLYIEDDEIEDDYEEDEWDIEEEL